MLLLYDRVAEWIAFAEKWEVLVCWLRTMFVFNEGSDLTEVPECTETAVK